MQSPTTVAARAVIMLGSLALILVVALFWNSLPELAAKLLGGQSSQEIAFCRDNRSEAPEPCPEEEAPLFPSPSATPGDNPVAASLGNDEAQVVPARVLPARIVPSAGAGMPAGYDPPMGLAGRSPVAAPRGLQEGFDQASPTGAAPLQSSAPQASAGRLTRPEPVAPQLPPATTGQLPTSVTQSLGSPTPAPAQGGTFVLIQERLQDLGAVYYRLESWGTQQQLFRFQCEMAVDGSRGLTRHFEAVDSHPLLAMHKVLAEAEAWRASR